MEFLQIDTCAGYSGETGAAFEHLFCEQTMKSTEHVSLPGTELQTLVGDHKIATAVDESERIQVTLALHRKEELPSEDTLHSTLSSEHAHLELDELEDKHGAHPDSIDEVRKFAREHGLEITSEDPGSAIVQLEGRIGDFNTAFDVKLENREDVLGEFRGHQGLIHLPKTLAEHVEGVAGLDSRKNLSTPPKDSLLQYRFAPAPDKLHPYRPQEIADIYNFPKDLDGSGETIGIISLGGRISMADMDAYFRKQGLRTPRIKTVNIPVPGSRGRPQRASAELQTSHDIEATLDVQLAGAFAPGARIVLYSIDDRNHYLTAIKAAIHDKKWRPSVLSYSFGLAERHCLERNLQLSNEAFEEAALLGISICAAAGDGGSATLFYSSFVNPPPMTHVLFPACSPFVLACGATSLPRNGIETVWNDLGQCRAATGGGVSVHFSRPKYQEGCDVPVNPTQGVARQGRGVPDVAASADVRWGYEIIYKGQALPAGATSASTPIWAALIARFNQGLGRRLGHVNPLFYRLADSGGFVSIKQGFNGAYRAKDAWDCCTGLGRPDGQRLFRAIQETIGASEGRLPTPPAGNLGRSAVTAANQAQLAANAAAMAARNRW